LRIQTHWVLRELEYYGFKLGPNISNISTFSFYLRAKMYLKTPLKNYYQYKLNYTKSSLNLRFITDTSKNG